MGPWLVEGFQSIQGSKWREKNKPTWGLNVACRVEQGGNHTIWLC